jgi:hypothetical protein
MNSRRSITISSQSDIAVAVPCVRGRQAMQFLEDFARRMMLSTMSRPSAEFTLI